MMDWLRVWWCQNFHWRMEIFLNKSVSPPKWWVRCLICKREWSTK